MPREERLDIAAIDERGALRLSGQQEPGVEAEAGPRIKGQPGQDVEVGFQEGAGGLAEEVDEPRCELGRVGGGEGFVGGEDGEEDGDDAPVTAEELLAGVDADACGRRGDVRE